MSCAGDNYVVPGANPCNDGGGGGVAGVTSLNSFQGAVNITAGNASIGVSNQGGNIVLTASGLQAVESINGEGGVLTFSGTGATTISNTGQAFTIDTTIPANVGSVNSLTGALTLSGAGATTVTNVGNALTVNTTIPANVGSVNSLTGALTLSGTGATTVSNVGNAISVNTTIPANVGSVNSLTGALTLSGTGATTVTNVGNAISVNTTLPSIVNTLNTLSGAVTLTGGTNVTLTPSGNNITISATAGGGGVSSVEGQTGAVDFTSTDGSVSFTASAGTIDFSASGGGGGVTSLNALTGNLDLVSTDGSVIIGSAGSAIDLSVPAGPAVVDSIAGLTGAITLGSSDNTVTITASGSDIDLTAVSSVARPTYTIYVSPDGNDTTGTGSIALPFLTIQKAIDYRLASIDLTAIVEVLIYAGTYNEDLNIIWGNMIFTAYGSNMNNLTQVDLTGTTLAIALTSVAISSQIIGFTNFTMVNNIAISSSSTILINFTLSFNNCFIQGDCQHTSSANYSKVTYTDCKFYSNIDLPLINNLGCDLNIYRCNMEHGNAVTNPLLVIQDAAGTGKMGTLNLQYSTLNSSLSPSNPSASNMAPIIVFAGGSSTTEDNNNYIIHNTLMYKWIFADVSGNRCCIQFNKPSAANIQLTNVSFNSFLCDGAITGSPQNQCIQHTGLGTVLIRYFGGNYAGAAAHHIANSITITSNLTEVV